ncbi:hypothetical protein NPIL_575941 [Nephila pilipes]|uniref:Uncharacterized protein n=1 Tax=Nephila pilipes TaxID=299642 RepID=A0A8X6QG35_NEPPI|nr:hypothetical protein NPIL_575941 [Nephila pilipes]
MSRDQYLPFLVSQLFKLPMHLLAQVGYAAPCKGNPQRRGETSPVPAMSQVFLLQSSVNATYDPHGRNLNVPIVTGALNNSHMFTTHFLPQ